MNRRTLLILIGLAAAGTAWRSYPHLTIPDLMPSDEYHNWFFLQYLVTRHQPYGGWFVPPLQLYIMWGVNLLTKIDILTLCKYTNPVVGGLMVFPVYFFLSSFLNRWQSILGCVLFMASENMFYRTCYFGSTEALGIVFMFVFLGLWLRGRRLLSLLVLPLIALSHVAPLLFAIGYVTLQFLYSRRTIPLALATLFMTVGFIMGPLSPHRVQTMNILSGALHFSPSNLFLYTPMELASVGIVSYLGLVMLMCNVSLRFWKWREPSRSMFILSLLAFACAWLLYNTRVASPRRFLTYTAIAVIPVFVSRKRRKWVYPVVISAMLAAPLLGGTNNFVWLSDSLTQPEVKALQWLDANGYFSNTTHKDWFGDRAVMQYVSARISLEGLTNRTMIVVNPDWVGATQMLLGQEAFIQDKTENETKTPQGWSYVFLSERMRHNAYFVITDWVRGTRSETYHVPIVDKWSGDPSWVSIYNQSGVVIYEKVEK